MIRFASLTAALTLLASPALAQDDGERDTPPWSQADEYYDKDEMAAARDAVLQGHGAGVHSFVMADRFELQLGEDEEALVWDAQGWYGGDINKLWIKTEGEVSLSEDEIEEVEIQALWSRAISPNFDLQAGLRYDFEPGGRTHAVVGVQGLAPYWFEIDATAFLSTDGDITARIEAEYEFLISQRLILQPRVEIELAAQDRPERGVGSGLTSLDAGLRLRYEFAREFAPYVGVEWHGAFGETADIIEAAGGKSDAAVILIGIRAWH